MLQIEIALSLLSLVCLISLFSLKYWELRTEKQLYPAFRARADEESLKLKRQIAGLRYEVKKIPPLAVVYLQMGIREIALLSAQFGRFLEKESHALADMVSHKHRFERRESKNEFLKRVGEVKTPGPIDS